MQSRDAISRAADCQWWDGQAVVASIYPYFFGVSVPSLSGFLPVLGKLPKRNVSTET